MYRGSSFGFVYVTSLMAVRAKFRWRAYSASPPWYSEGSADIPPGQKSTIVFGIATPYVQFEVNPPIDSFLLVH